MSMTSPKAPKDKIFEKVINPYLTGVLQHPQSIEMREGMLHIRDVEGPKKTGSVEARLEAMEQLVFKCQGMVERGLNSKHMMIMEFTSKHMIDANDIGKHLPRLYNRIDHLQAQIYDLHKQNYEYEYRFKSIRLFPLSLPARASRPLVVVAVAPPCSSPEAAHPTAPPLFSRGLPPTPFYRPTAPAVSPNPSSAAAEGHHLPDLTVLGRHVKPPCKTHAVLVLSTSGALPPPPQRSTSK
ncbi:40S ribosomal protein S5-1 [Hordeum vulgare]|nr:40S ribosomal protein S5-1 [Hordeum vulgare]